MMKFMLGFILGAYTLWTAAVHSVYKDQRKELERIKSSDKTEAK